MGSLNVDFKRHLTLRFQELLQGRSILALSGGIDSTVLCELLKETGVAFSVAHCNFQLRGKESDEDQKFVEAMAQKMNLEVHTKKFDTFGFSEEYGLSLQVAARDLRYQWFAELLDSTSSDYLITAHHADDNMETFLMNLSRGSGLKGLTGIPERNGRIRRPMIAFQRKEIENYARENKVSWTEDRSNAKNKYLRNRIRNELIPLMKEVIPNLETGFRSTLEHLKESQILLDKHILDVWTEVSETRGNLTEIDIERIQSLNHPKAYLFGLLSQFGFNQWTDIEALLTTQSGKMVFSPTHRLLKDRDFLLLQKIDSLPDSSKSHLVQKKDLSTYVGSGALHLAFEKEPQMESNQKESYKTTNKVSFDSDKVKFPLSVRKWQKGDYFYPKGMRGSKKLSKFFKDEKLSVPEKENIWLLCSDNEVIWVIGRRSDERFKVTDTTKSVLHVEWIPK